MLFTTISPGQKNRFFSFLLIAELIVLITIEYYFPDLLLLYPNKESRTLDLIISYFFSMLGIFVCVNIFLKLYRQTHQKLNEQNEQLTTQNDQILKQHQKIREQARMLEKRNQQLLELNEFKEGMTGMVVHDLKNPLNIILNGTQMPSTYQREKVHSAAQQMLNMVMNILDINRYENAKLDISTKSVNVVELIRGILEQMEFLCQKKNIQITTHIPETLYIQADQNLIERVFINLLTNGIKFSPPSGTIQLFFDDQTPEYQTQIPDTIKAAIKENPDYGTFGIFNEGTHIPEREKKLIFKKFGQLKAKKSDLVQSSGLGLTFCEIAIKAHGGVIDFKNHPSGGITFCFTTPIANTEARKNKTAVSFSKTKPLFHEIKESSFPALKVLKDVKIYEITKIRKILSEIEVSNSNLKPWKEEFLNAVNCADHTKFNQMIKGIL